MYVCMDHHEALRAYTHIRLHTYFCCAESFKHVVGVYLSICFLTLKHFAQSAIYHMQVSVCIVFDELS